MTKDDHLYPSQRAERIIVRLPDGMRDRLAEVAKENKRSTNAEVVDRLERSFAREAQQVMTFIHVVLDADGKPTSWGEIHEHLRAISKAGQLNVVAMEVSVVTPEMMSSSQRDDDADALASFYRRVLKRHKEGETT